MGGVIRRAELARPPAGQCLALVAPGEERELLWILGADPRQPLRGDAQRFIPADLLEFARTAWPHAQQRAGQPGRRVLRHDAGRTLAAENAVIDRMVAIALDVANLAVKEVHLDPAATGAHVAGGAFHLVGNAARQ